MLQEGKFDFVSGKSKGLGYVTAIEEYVGGNRVKVASAGEMTMFGGYSYASLNEHLKIHEAACTAIKRYGTGTHGVRLLAGTLDLVWPKYWNALKGLSSMMDSDHGRQEEAPFIAGFWG